MEIITLPVGQLQTNAYLLADPASGDAAVIDPGGEGERILAEARKRGWRIAHLWYTHAHFDHIGGAGAIADALNPLPLVALHPADHALWRAQGGAPIFGMTIDPGPEPTIDFVDGMVMKLGTTTLEVRYTPGHTPGHCVIYCAEEKTCFCGDLIFEQGIGRTDLPGGDLQTLLDSLHTKIFDLPDETRLLPGHGPATTVGDERPYYPFLSQQP
jgi:glyoxylase-like metal-dependent hydrolase (beta-lactamase superfamily II)